MKKFVLLMAVILVLLASGYWLSSTFLGSGKMSNPASFEVTSAASPTPTEPGAMEDSGATQDPESFIF
jgi:hypothetical protein